MNIHEYQGKEIFRSMGVAVPEGRVAFTAEEAVEKAKELNSDVYVVKAQIHAGGRGKAGGVKIAKSLSEVETYANELLGKQLVTHQTGPEGKEVKRLYIEEGCDIQKEYYVGFVIDRATDRITLMASEEGGTEIEEVAAKTPEKIFKEEASPLVGLQPYQAREMAFKLGLQGKQINTFVEIMTGLYQAFIDNDFSLVEINPLSVRGNGNLVCVDAKISVDSNALFRHPDLLENRDTSQENERELAASEYGLNYVALEGNIGCMVNGAGLAMATMDIIQLYGGKPANFLDVGGGATKEDTIKALSLILEDRSVQAVLINIFGGIVRCDMIADAIIEAIKSIDIKVPVVVRLEGNQADKGLAKLDESGLQVITAHGLADAAEKVVAATKKNYKGKWA